MDPIVSTESTVTVVCDCAAVLESYLPPILEGLEHLYALGLFTVGLVGAGTVCMILYGIFKRILR